MKTNCRGRRAHHREYDRFQIDFQARTGSCSYARFDFSHKDGLSHEFHPWCLFHACQKLPYHQKLPKYEASQYRLIQEVRAPDWTPEAIEQRQAQLARRACHVWRFDP